jgi:hypothetical protein
LSNAQLVPVNGRLTSKKFLSELFAVMVPAVTEHPVEVFVLTTPAGLMLRLIAVPSSKLPPHIPTILATDAAVE